LRLSEFERDAAVFCSAVNRERYLQGAGHKTELELSPLYTAYRQLFDIETFHEMREVQLDEPLDDKYRRFLLDFIAEHYLELGVAERTEAIATAEATTMVEWRGQELTYRTAPLVIANEPDPDRRHELNERWREACAAINPLRGERHRATLALVSELDHGGYLQVWDTLRGLNLERLTTQAGELLASTADIYRDTLRDALADEKLTVENAWRADLSYVLRGKEYDDWFPRRELVPTLIATLRTLGFDLEEQSNIKLDVEPRSTKSPRAFCAPILVPSDVRLVLQPIGGHQDYDTLLHEAGHAEHFANVDPTLPFAYRWLGDSSITEGYAFLLQYLTTEPIWLRKQLRFDTSDEFRRFALFQKLQLLRRYSTKLFYEQELQRAEEPEPLAERYADLFTHHLLVRYAPDEYLADVDDGLYAAQYLRAWIFEAQLREFLRNEFDEEWFRSPRAGRFLRDLWRDGQKHTADELVRFMGYDDLAPDLLLGEIREALAQ
jgi:hypothetical protein